MLSRGLLVLGGTAAATAAAWTLSSTQASASEGPDQAVQHATTQQAEPPHESTVDKVAEPVGKTAGNVVRDVTSTVHDTLHAATDPLTRPPEPPPRTSGEFVQRAGQTGAAVHDTVDAAASGVGKTAGDLRDGVRDAVGAFGERLQPGQLPGHGVPNPLDPDGSPAATGTNGAPAPADGDAAATAPEPAGVQAPPQAPTADPAHPSAEVPHGPPPGAHSSELARSDGHQTDVSAPADRGRHGSPRHAPRHHEGPITVPGGAGTVNTNSSPPGSGSGVLPELAAPAAGSTVTVLSGANEDAPFSSGKQPGTSPD